MTPALRLVAPLPAEPDLSEKPSQWRGAVEAHTRAHRAARARALRDRGRERAEEAMGVHAAIVEGYREELGLWPLSKFRALPGGSPEIQKILRQWDREIQTASGNTRRLLRAERETTASWTNRIFAEIERRVESTWHAARANGQLERFRRVEKCGTETRGVLVCMHCKNPQHDHHGNARVLRELCGAFVLCPRCRKLRGAKYRARIERARGEAIRRVRAAHLGPGVAKTDPIADRFLTLTCPHLPADAAITVELPTGELRELKGPEAQAWIVRHAWRPFMNALRNHWKKRGRERFELCHFVRVIEATSGTDELGHLHVHAWLLAPFVRVHVIRFLWGRALLRAGFPLELWPEHAWKEKPDVLAELQTAGDDRALRWARKILPRRAPWPRVDIRRVYPKGQRAELDAPTGGRVDMISELVKYLVKDWQFDESGRQVLMHPTLFAAVYRGLDSGRLISASRGLWVRYHAECQHCGAQDLLRPVGGPTVRKVARAPPLFAGLRLVESLP